MVDYYGNWTEEKDYSVYPKDKWCDYDHMAAFIREKEYKPKTTMENLISMIFAHYESVLEDNNEECEFNIEDCKMYAIENGFCEFDYYC
jgi:hypothetical protein